MIHASGLGKRYGAKRVLHGLNFELEQGGFLLVTGPNGSGKTTLLRLCAGLAAPTSGELEVRIDRARLGFGNGVLILADADPQYGRTSPDSSGLRSHAVAGGCAMITGGAAANFAGAPPILISAGVSGAEHEPENPPPGPEDFPGAAQVPDGPASCRRGGDRPWTISGEKPCTQK